MLTKGWQVKLGRGGQDPGGCAQQAWERRFLALEERTQLALCQQHRGQGTCCFGGSEREGSERLGRAGVKTWVSLLPVSAPASIALFWVDSDHVTPDPNPFLGDSEALNLALKACLT